MLRNLPEVLENNSPREGGGWEGGGGGGGRCRVTSTSVLFKMNREKQISGKETLRIYLYYHVPYIVSKISFSIAQTWILSILFNYMWVITDF